MEFRKFPSLATVSTDNPSVDPHLYSIVHEGHLYVTISVYKCAVDLVKVLENSLIMMMMMMVLVLTF
jgi:hypothetical protein